MEALNTFLDSRPGTPDVFWKPRAAVDLHPQEATEEDEGEKRVAGDENQKQKDRKRGHKSSTQSGHRDINLVLDLFKTRDSTNLKTLRLKDFRRVFGHKDKQRVQMGVDVQNLNYIFNDIFEFIDKDRKGYVKIDDFMRILFRRLSKAQIEELKYTFRAEIGDEEEEKVLPGLSEEQVEEMRELYKLYDLDGQGMMGFDAFEAAISESWAVKPPRQEMLDYFQEADRKHKGHITLADFINWLQKTLWVDFMDLSKGSTQSFRKYTGHSGGFRHQRRQAFAEEGVQEVKTLLDIVDGGKKKLGRDFVFEQSHLTGHKGTLQRMMAGQLCPVHSTLAYPVGPVWRPPVQVVMRRYARTSTPEQNSTYDQNGRRSSAESLGKRPHSTLAGRPSTSLGATRRSTEAPPDFLDASPQRPWTADGGNFSRQSSVASDSSSHFSRTASMRSSLDVPSRPDTPGLTQMSRLGSRPASHTMTRGSRPSTAATSVRWSMPPADAPAKTEASKLVERPQSVHSTKEEHALAPMCIVPMHAAQTRLRVRARQGGTLQKSDGSRR